MPAVSPARKAAYGILLAVERGKSHSDDLLRGKTVNALSPADRNLTTALVLGALRWQIHLDHQLHLLLKRPNAKLDLEILIALRLGAFQLLHLDRIPARAAIDESVELAKQSGHRFASRMVNAVLRKLAGASDGVQDSAENDSALKGHVFRTNAGFSPGGKSSKRFRRSTRSNRIPSHLDGRALGWLLRPRRSALNLPPRPDPARSVHPPGQPHS